MSHWSVPSQVVSMKISPFGAKVANVCFRIPWSGVSHLVSSVWRQVSS